MVASITYYRGFISVVHIWWWETGLNVPVDRAETQDAHTVVQHLAGGLVQSHTGLLELRLATNNLEHIVAGAEHVGHAEQVGEDSSGLQGAGRVEQHIGPLGEQTSKVGSVGLGQEAQVGRVELVDVQAGLAHNGAETGVSVLQVRTGVTLERGHGIQVEVIAVDTVFR